MSVVVGESSTSPTRGRWWAATVLFVALSAPAPEAQALGSERALAQAGHQIQHAVTGIADVKGRLGTLERKSRTAEQRIAEATLLMGAKDWSSASLALNQLVDEHADHPTAYADGLDLLGESYFRSGQLLSARRAYLRMLDAPGDPRLDGYRERALSRLVDIALRKRDEAQLREAVSRADAVPADADGLVAYARGRALYGLGDLAGASASLAAVQPSSPHAHRAAYMQGVVALREASGRGEQQEAEGELGAAPSRFARPLELFEHLTALPSRTQEQRHLVDLGHLAVGRLLYESGQYAAAARAYGRIERRSREFGTMLYELAWVYVRLGDLDRARRALELLAVAAPDAEDVADATLLRGDLMLRAGKFDRALDVYQSAHDSYDPMRERVEALLTSATDPSWAYELFQPDRVDLLAAGGALPALAIAWAREMGEGPAASAIVRDGEECRLLIQQSEEMVARLEAVLGSSSQLRAFPLLKPAYERLLSLLNEVAMARYAIGQGLDDVDDGSLSGEVGSVRRARRALEARLVRLPVSASDFAQREQAANKQWNSVSQAVQRLELEVDHLQSVANGLRRMLDEGPSVGVVRDAGTIQRLRGEIAENERAIAAFRAEIGVLRRQIQRARAQAGLGDARFVQDAEVRKAYRDALWREVTLLSSGAGGGSLAAYARRAAPLLRAADEADQRLAATEAEIDQASMSRTEGARVELQAEATALVGYRMRLEELDGEARQLVGVVALESFAMVRDRLKGIVLRADVGITEHAWEVREEQLTRVRALQRERTRDIRRLDQELKDVLDDGAPREEAEP